MPQETPGRPPDQGPRQQMPAAADETGTEPQQRPSVSDTLRELERMRREATQRGQDSERLREAARELADNLTEDEKRELAERWLPNPDTESGTSRVGSGLLDEQTPEELPPFDTFEDVDLRGDDADEGQIISEWLGPEGGDGEPAPPARGRALARKARSDAERAVEKAVVPSRYYRFIQRYFGRLEETVDKAAGTTAPPGDDQP
jgi:hypothetical protein